MPIFRERETDSGAGTAWQWAWLGLGLAIGALLAVLLAWVVLEMRSSPPAARLHFSIGLPEAASLDDKGNPLAISPDGSRLCFVAQRTGGTLLFLRPLDEPEAHPLAGTEGAYGPFFSPDGQRIGYFDGSRSKLSKVSIHGGEIVNLCDAASGAGAAWGADGTIVFAPDVFSGLWRVPSDGGEALPLTELERGELAHRLPVALPDGRTVLFTVETAGTPTTTRMAAVSLANGERKIILDQAAAVEYLPTGHLLFLRSGQIEAQAFDRRRLVLRGPSLSVLPEVRIDPSGPAAQLAVSRNGALVYVSADHRSNLRSLVWADPKGAMERITVSQGVFSYPRISPDGARLAVVAYTPEGTARLCTVDTAAGDIAPLQTEGNSIMPLWTPDGRWITFASDKEGQWNIYMIPADGTGGAALLLKGDHPRVPTSWSADGRHLCLTEFHPASGADIWILSVRDSRAWPFLQRAGGEWGGVFSPDGAWLSYTSNESGPNHVYVRPFPGPGEPFQVSTAQGEEPVWAAGGLFYRYWDRLMSVAFPRGAGAAPEAPQFVLEGAFEKSELPAFQNYDVAGGGARFVFVTGDRPSTVLHFRYDWFAELARLLSGSPPD